MSLRTARASLAGSSRPAPTSRRAWRTPYARLAASRSQEAAATSSSLAADTRALRFHRGPAIDLGQAYLPRRQPPAPDLEVEFTDVKHVEIDLQQTAAVLAEVEQLPPGASESAWPMPEATYRAAVEYAARRSQRLSPGQWPPSRRHVCSAARSPHSASCPGCRMPGSYLMSPVFSSRMMTRPVVATKVVAAQTMGSAASLVKWAPVM